ncbi:hypothetical protein ABS784_14845 [Geobacillus sp. G4]|uniref:hypothetical protein n=1 Tax=Geobacillus TaxID=129337 RepID=UPI001D040285|nr:hypothetical protein [Geobacillus kaustophilus]MED4974194.1 hypothetical protein [Geobacillus thermoleovorans]
MDAYVLEAGRFRHQGMYVRDETIPVRPFPGFEKHVCGGRTRKNSCCSNSRLRLLV